MHHSKYKTKKESLGIHPPYKTCHTKSLTFFGILTCHKERKHRGNWEGRRDRQIEEGMSWTPSRRIRGPDTDISSPWHTCRLSIRQRLLDIKGNKKWGIRGSQHWSYRMQPLFEIWYNAEVGCTNVYLPPKNPPKSKFLSLLQHYDA